MYNTKEKSFIIDIGSSMIKYGPSSLSYPYSYTNIVGKERFRQYFSSDDSLNKIYGNRAGEIRGVLHLEYPVSRGCIKDFDDFENIIKDAFSDIGVDLYDCPVVLAQPPLNSKTYQEHLMYLFFEHFYVSKFYSGVQAIFNLFSLGQVTGLSVDSGHGLTQIVPVYEGYGLSQGINKFELAGEDVTDCLVRLLFYNGVYLRTTAEMCIAKLIKEENCYVHLDFEENEKYYNKGVCHTLPDGQTINLNRERFMAPEILFTPSLFGRQEKGISESINQSIQQCYSEFREVLSENIIISGGNSKLPGFEERIINDLNKNKLFSRNLRARFTQHKTESSWIGAKIFSELQCSDEYWITKEEYEENGLRIIHRKCF